MFRNLGYTKKTIKEGVLFVYERASDIDGYFECIYFDEVLEQFMANEMCDGDEDEISSKYLSIEELIAINRQMIELGWHSDDSEFVSRELSLEE